MNLEDLAKQLANRVNQLHYVKWTLDKVAKNAYKKGFEDGQEQIKNNALLHNVSNCNCNKPIECRNCGDMVIMVSEGEFCPHCYC